MPPFMSYGDFPSSTAEDFSHFHATTGEPAFHVDSQWAVLDSSGQQYPYDTSFRDVWSQSAEQSSYYTYPTMSMPHEPLKYQVNPQNSSSWTRSYETYRDLRYNSPSGHYGGTLSDSSSDYTRSPETSRGSFTLTSNQSDTFHFAPLPADPLMTQQPVWPSAQDFVTLPSPVDVPHPSMQAIASMRELEVESTPELNFEQPTLEDRLSSVQIHRPFQQPEELDLSESIPPLTFSSRATTLSSQTTEVSDEEALSSVHDHESDSDFNPNRRRSTSKYLTASHAASRGHHRSNSGASVRVRSQQTSHPVLDASSRIHKQRTPRNSMTSHAAAKEKARFKTSSSRSGSSTEKQPKFFPCAFHAFGCPSTFANKNEWKRHVYSQHLQLGFYRCDLGQCNPEYNPKLYVQSDKGSRNHLHETGEEDEEREVIYNDFNRKDLFTQHCRRMHGPHRYADDNTTVTNQKIVARAQRQLAAASASTGAAKSKARVSVTKEDEADFENELESIRSRCRLIRRKAPRRTCCGFCNRLFQAETGDQEMDDTGKAEERAWEERMEHVGRHYERDGCSARLENVDDDLLEWGLEVGILERVVDNHGQSRVWLVGYELRELDVKGEDDEEMPQSGDMNDMDWRLEQRRRGLRSGRAAPRARDEIVSPIKKEEKKELLFDSEDDASAEDE